MFNIDIFSYIIELKILNVREICRLSRVNKVFYNLIHNETTIKTINKLIRYYDDLYKISYTNLLYKTDSYKYPIPINELVVSSWYPLYFKEIKNYYNLKLNWTRKYDNILKCYTLCSTYQEIDLKLFNNIHYADLSYSYNLTDVSMLKNLHTLKLNRCSSIKNVSMLGNLKHLDLSYTNVKDVSMLGNVETLILYHTKVKDVSKLLNVKYLDISYCDIEDVSSLYKTKYIKMSAINTNDVSMLTQVEYLNISWCVFVKDVSNLKNLKILKIDGLLKLDTSMLKNTKIIKF